MIKKVAISHSAHQERYAERYGHALLRAAKFCQLDLQLVYIAPPQTSVDLARFDGIIFTGGRVKEQNQYSEQLKEMRNELEIGMLRDWLFRKPMLGICRGMQLINILAGGSIKECSGHNLGKDTDQDRWRDEVLHQIYPSDLGLYRWLFGIGSHFGVNSRHEKCIDALAPALQEVAHAIDGVVEALVGPKLIGVQCHPEDGIYYTHMQSVFIRFAEMIASDEKIE